MIRQLAGGAAAGALSTATMSAVMLAGQKAGLMPGQPPKHIVRAALPGHRHRPKRGEKVLGAAAHLGFGAASGAAFALLTRGRRSGVPLGVGYALLIWLAAYEGWVPALNILPPASRDPAPGRPVVMAVAHVVYGTTLALAVRAMRGTGERHDQREESHRRRADTRSAVNPVSR
ncbi:hypothetical protein GCM10010116_03640 [Microbispora rosea subsp. aerata]|nr:DUF6789 family protein [Microbispora rosea]GGO01936.1 hypothetical protein GCM10010116_03640 [Microbispora rosea subsp. aerata]GIH54735.1 hypothetical protein Mro02_16490 [Microbispora rosea subsp. aerata]GLJ82402.1 hypothetical protein GCM10017588_11270 [Microbispora rosea subsp. aerata]